DLSQCRGGGHHDAQDDAGKNLCEPHCSHFLFTTSSPRTVSYHRRLEQWGGGYHAGVSCVIELTYRAHEEWRIESFTATHRKKMPVFDALRHLRVEHLAKFWTCTLELWREKPYANLAGALDGCALSTVKWVAVSS